MNKTDSEFDLYRLMIYHYLKNHDAGDIWRYLCAKSAVVGICGLFIDDDIFNQAWESLRKERLMIIANQRKTKRSGRRKVYTWRYRKTRKWGRFGGVFSWELNKKNKVRDNSKIGDIDDEYLS